MPTKVEKDSVTGTETTGHEWDGIKELNTPLPKWWVYVFYATVIWSVIYLFLYPAIPLGVTYTRGLLGYDQRATLDGILAEARAAQAVFRDRIEQATTGEIRADPELLQFALAGGQASFADNCAPCHGLGGAGNPGGFPVLADDEWLWGGSLDAIQFTIRHGVRNDDDPDARLSTMPAYGRDGLLTRAEIEDTAAYVLALSGQAHDEAAAGRGAAIFEQQCASCHAVDGTGLHELGAPNLTDAIWLYGGTRADIMAQLQNPQLGVMPPWTGRLDESTVKMLTVYVHGLGGGQ